MHEDPPPGIGLAIHLVLLWLSPGENFWSRRKTKWRKPKLYENPPSTFVRVELLSLGLGFSISPLIAFVSVEWHSLGLSSWPPLLVFLVYVGGAPPLVPLVRVELHSLGLGVSVSPLVPLVSVELHLLGLCSWPSPQGLGSVPGLADTLIR